MGYMLLAMLDAIIEIAIYLALCVGFGLDSSLIARSLILYVVFMYVYGHYSLKTSLIWEEIRKIVKGLVAYVVAIMVFLSIHETLWTRLSILLIAGIMLIVDIIVCRYLRSIILRKYVAKRTLVIGTGKEAMHYVEIASRNRFALTMLMGMISIECYPERKTMGRGKSKMTIYPYAELDQVIKNKKITQIVIIEPDLEKEQFDELMTDLYNKVTEIKYMPEVHGMLNFSSEVQDFDGMLLISTAKDKMNVLDRFAKRIIDIVAGVVGCILVLPLAIYVKLKYVKAGDKDPIFFKQERIGMNGKTINIYKFRTMVPNAETILEELMEKDSQIREEYLTNKKLQNDPRVTAVGEKLRHSSLDEFPQFLNVIKGEMSLVGPRPYLWREKEDMGVYYDSIIACKPGVTGMWQAHGRSDVDFKERCKLDDYYYKNWSVWLDVVITYKTIKSVIYGHGAV